MTGTITATPDPVDRAQELEICVSGFAGSSVTVFISNGSGLYDQVKIDLDGDGAGCAKWSVPIDPAWTGIFLNAMGAKEVVVGINP
jgi:hypothetical protein